MTRAGEHITGTRGSTPAARCDATILSVRAQFADPSTTAL
jgi:hypothetical protein